MHTAGGDVNWCKHCGNQCRVPTDEPHTSGQYPRAPHDTPEILARPWSPLRMAGKWKVSSCSPTEEWITDVYTIGLYLIGDKNEIMKFTSK